MRLQDVLDKESVSKLNNVQNDISFEEAYDKGLAQLNQNRKRLSEFKSMREAENFIRKKKLHS